MHLLTVLAFSILVTIRLGTALATTYPLTNLQNKSRIFNGAGTYRGRFQYAVRLSVESTYQCERRCGGALISYRWVLTCAHCVYDTEKITVFLGSNCLDDAVATYEVNKTSVLIHYEWNPINRKNDIALLKIPKIPIDSRVIPVRLPRRGAPYPDYFNNRGIAVGWGKLGVNRPFADCLQWTYIMVMRNADCHPYYNSENVHPENICAIGYYEEAPCTGDTGGPLVKDFTGELIGLISFTNKSRCESGEPALYIRITAYIDWIKNLTGISY